MKPSPLAPIGFTTMCRTAGAPFCLCCHCPRALVVSAFASPVFGDGLSVGSRRAGGRRTCLRQQRLLGHLWYIAPRSATRPSLKARGMEEGIARAEVAAQSPHLHPCDMRAVPYRVRAVHRPACKIIELILCIHAIQICISKVFL
jgi:hypothetical protein